MVVVIVVIFWSKNKVQETFDPKTIHVHNTLGLKELDPTKNWKKKVRSQEVKVQKMNVKKIRFKKFWVPINFSFQKFLSPTNFGYKTFW